MPTILHSCAFNPEQLEYQTRIITINPTILRLSLILLFLLLLLLLMLLLLFLLMLLMLLLELYFLLLIILYLVVVNTMLTHLSWACD